MSKVLLFLFAIFIIGISTDSALCKDMLKITAAMKGTCLDSSHVAEGGIGDDLRNKQSRYFCDTAMIVKFANSQNHIMIQFGDSKANHGRLLGFAGIMNNNIMEVHNMYLETTSASPVEVDGGFCKIFYKGDNLDSIVCGAKADKEGRRTVAIVEFHVKGL